MAATEKKNIWCYSTEDGLGVEVQTQLIAASQGLWMPNTPFYVSQAGTLKLSDTADGTGDSYHGLALRDIDAELSANAKVRIGMIEVNDTYAVYLENNGTDLAESQAYVGDQYGLKVSSTAGQIGYTTLDINNANACVQVVDIMSNRDSVKFDTSTTPGVALVRFLSTVVKTTRA